LNGIVMGGGAGLSTNGRFRIATENTVFFSYTCPWMTYRHHYEICLYISSHIFWVSSRFSQCLRQL